MAATGGNQKSAILEKNTNTTKARLKYAQANQGLILAWVEVFVKGSCIEQDDGAMKCDVIDFNYGTQFLSTFRHVGTDTERNFGDQDPRSLKKRMSTKIAKYGVLVVF